MGKALAIFGMLVVNVMGAPDPPDSQKEEKSLPQEAGIRLPLWLTLGGEYRVRVEAQDGINYSSVHDLYQLGRARFHLRIAIARWLNLYAESQDARIYFNQAIPSTLPYEDTWNLRQAYIQLGDPKDGRLDLIAGKQVLSFGDERVIGPSDWTNAARTFDAVRLNLHFSKSQVSLFASSVVAENNRALEHDNEGNNLHGVYGSLEHVIPQAKFEPYVLWRVAPDRPAFTASTLPGKLNEVTTGFRAAGKLPRNFDYDVEMNIQTGSLGVRSIRAWSGFWRAGRSFPNVRLAPRIFVESSYATGTRDPQGTVWQTFDQIYPSNHDKLGFADQIGRRNIRQVRLGAQQTLKSGWKLRQTYESFWLATVNDALYSNGGTVAVAALPGASSHVGQEVDVTVEYQARFGLLFEAGYAYLFRGQFLRQAGRRRDFQYPFISVTYKF